jgi:mono/diheme cytochrome c family protein
MRATPVIAGLLGLVGLISVGAYQAGVGLSGIQQTLPGPGTLLTASAAGPTLYGANCAGCHGAQAQGAVGPTLSGEVGQWTAPQFARAVLDGQDPEGKALAPLMPHFRTAGFDGLPPTDAQLIAVQAFLKGL